MIPLIKAIKLATRVVEVLQPHTDVINVVGSIRRQKPEVKDIEIICLPSTEIVDTDLFNKSTRVKKDFANAVSGMANKIIKGNTSGRYMQVELKGGSVLDLFMPAPADYYRQLATRTGSADYSAFIIAGGWRRQGWCGSDKGLRRITDCVQVHENNWRCINPDAELPPVWRSEEEFFDWINVKWIAPKFREVKQSINQYK